MPDGDKSRVRVPRRKAAAVVDVSVSGVQRAAATHRASFTVLGPPQPWQRAGATRSGVRYTRPETARYERAIKVAAMTVRLHTDTWPKDGRYRLHVVAVFVDSRRRDLDNVLKAVCDALSGVAYLDDSQIDSMHIERLVNLAKPRTDITIEVVP